MSIVQSSLARIRNFLSEPSGIAQTRADGKSFYQACDLPGLGFIPGQWDHRGSENVYLAHTDFAGMTAIDVGPANGFWSFEMERRGAKVTAIELGPDDDWDAVPHGGKAQPGLSDILKSNVEQSLADFQTCRTAYNSSVEIKRASAYNVPKVVAETDIALMGNILQHIRDPFLAIERVASVVRHRIIISESLWIDDSRLMKSARMQLIPRSHTPVVNHSWYQVTPVYVGEILNILGFTNLKCEMHLQKFNGTNVDSRSRMVPHFTYSGDRKQPN